MSGKNVLALSVLMVVILILTGSVVGEIPRSPVLGGLAPILILTLITWYLIILVVNRDEITAGLAAIFRMRRKPEPVQANFWVTVAVYAALLSLALIALWSGLPQRILSRIQEIAMISGTENASRLLPRTNPIAGLLPATPFIYYGVLVSAAVFAVSFILLLGGLRLALKTGEMGTDDSSVEMKMNAAEVVRMFARRAGAVPGSPGEILEGVGPAALR